MENEQVWLKEERIWGTVMSIGATFSLIAYNWNGLPIEEWVENKDFISKEEL